VICRWALLPSARKFVTERLAPTQRAPQSKMRDNSARPPLPWTHRAT
jgi:hypothetical protein